MKRVKEFKIDVNQSVLDDLKVRLKHTRWTDEPEDAGWNYGTNPAYLRELTDYWQNRYHWREHEAALNEMPNFKTEIDGIDIHFVHVKGKGNNPKPLILTHGWPDSFYRFYKAIPMLTDPGKYGNNADESFDVVVPSIPGFGFSDKVVMDADKVAVLWSKLMSGVLGYSKFYAAAGDVGTRVTKSLANQFPELVTGIHLTDVSFPTGKEDFSKMTKAEQEFAEFVKKWAMTEGAYNMIQSTKPQTLGYGLNDSPVGLASWILEKFYAWSDNRGHLENSFTKDELLTNIMIYWVTQTINSSIRMYHENLKASMAKGGPIWTQHVNTPTGVAYFPGEPTYPREWAERMVNVKRFTKMPKGGHFAALEEPELWVDEIRSFFYEVI